MCEFEQVFVLKQIDIKVQYNTIQRWFEIKLFFIVEVL